MSVSLAFTNRVAESIRTLHERVTLSRGGDLRLQFYLPIPPTPLPAQSQVRSTLSAKEENCRWYNGSHATEGLDRASLQAPVP